MIRELLSGAVVIVLCLLGGHGLKVLTGWFVPVPVWGLLLLLALFMVLGRVPNGVRLVGAFLLRHMALFFIPPTLGLITMGPLILQDGLAIAISIVISTTIALVVTAGVFRAMERDDR